MDVEDIIFDYFGIITVQYEISNRQLDRDIQYQIMKQTHQYEIAQEFGKQDQPELTLETAQELGKKINLFTQSLMQKLARKDAGGQTYLDIQDG